MAYHLKPRMLFCDWHMPNFLPEVKIEYDEYFEQIKRTGAQSLIFQVKTAHGAAFAPTDIGITNQTMHGDLFGEICHRAKAAGLEFIAYYNMILSWELHRLHPEWEQIGRDGKPLRMYLYPCFCISGDAFRDHVSAHMAEVTARYPIDGWFLDLQYFSPEGCFCPACATKFSARFGYALQPDEFTTSQWLDLYTYQVDTREQFIHFAQDRCNAERPDLSWSWNGSGSRAGISDTLHERADYLSTEAHPPGYLSAQLAARYCQGLGKQFTLFMPESQGSWGDWTVTTPETTKGLSAVALAHAGSLNINHVPYPCGDYGGRVPQIVWDTIRETFDFVARCEPYSQHKQPVHSVAVIHSASNAKLLRAMTREPQYEHLREAAAGSEDAVAQLLIETHAQWELRPDWLSLEEMRQYELLILPYLPHISDDLADRLRAYVQGGGRLIADYHTSLFDAEGHMRGNFALADLFGADYQSTSEFSVSYLDGLDEALGDLSDMPLLVKDEASGRLNPRNHALQTCLRTGARALAWIMDPVIESDFETGYFVYHDHAPPAYRTDYPAIVLNSAGQGRVLYFPVPFFGGYATKRSPFLRALFHRLVQDILGVSQRVRIEAPPSVSASVSRDDEGWLVFLTHLQKFSDSMYLDSFHRPDPISVAVNPGWQVQAAYDCLSGQRYSLRTDGVWTDFTIPGIRETLIVRLER